MKFCNTHSHDLLAAIKRKGMGSHVSMTPGEAATKARMWLAGSLNSPRDFDPYVVSTLEVFQKAKDNFGSLPEHICPFCVADTTLKCAATWIDNVTDAMVMVCEANGIRRV